MSRQKLVKEKMAVGAITPQQPKMRGAATLTTRGESTLAEATEQVQIKADAVMDMLGNIFHDIIGHFESDVLVSRHQTLEEFEEKTFRGKIYQIRRSKRFYYLFKDKWVEVGPEDIREGERRKGWKKGAANPFIWSWEDVCKQFGQVVWKEVTELWGKAVIA